MRYLHWINGPGQVRTRETIFVIFFLNVGNFATVALSLHGKTAKLLNMAPMLPILKILQKFKQLFHH